MHGQWGGGGGGGGDNYQQYTCSNHVHAYISICCNQFLFAPSSSSPPPSIPAAIHWCNDTWSISVLLFVILYIDMNFLYEGSISLLVLVSMAAIIFVTCLLKSKVKHLIIWQSHLQQKILVTLYTVLLNTTGFLEMEFSYLGEVAGLLNSKHALSWLHRSCCSQPLRCLLCNTCPLPWLFGIYSIVMSAAPVSLVGGT